MFYYETNYETKQNTSPNGAFHSCISLVSYITGNQIEHHIGMTYYIF